MNRYLSSFFFILLFLVPRLGMAMELVNIDDMKKTHDIIKEGEEVKSPLIVLSDQDCFLRVGNGALNVLVILGAKQITSNEKEVCLLPQEICINILQRLSSKERNQLGLVSKGVYQNLLQGVHLFYSERKLQSLLTNTNFGEHYIDKDYESLVNATEIIESFSKKALLKEVKEQATGVLKANEEKAVSYLKEFEAEKGGFSKIQTVKYEDDFIYLSKVYNYDYEENSCCTLCCLNMKACRKSATSQCSECCMPVGACCLICCVVSGSCCYDACSMFKKTSCQLGIAAILCSPCIIACSPFICCGFCIFINNLDNIF